MAGAAGGGAAGGPNEGSLVARWGGKRARVAANIPLDYGEAVDDVAERAVDRFQRIMSAGDIALETIDVGRRDCARPAVLVRFDMHQKIGEPALQCFQMAEARIRGIELCHQADDAVFEMAEGIAAVA